MAFILGLFFCSLMVRMPFGKWNSFEDCVQDFVAQGKDEDSAKRICGALKARLEKSVSTSVYSWEGGIEPKQGNLIHGRAIHPVKTLHPEEWPSVRVYLEDELRRATVSLVGAPLLLDHESPLDGYVMDARYAEGAVEYVAELNDETVLDLIRQGIIRHCSVEYEWENLQRVNGAAPRGIKFTGLALLKNYEPGDPETTVQIWEGIIKRLKEASVRAASSQHAFLSLAGSAEKPPGQGIIEPAAHSMSGESLFRDEILAELRRICYERVPKHWSYGAHLQNRRLRELIRRLESQSQSQE